MLLSYHHLLHLFLIPVVFAKELTDVTFSSLSFEALSGSNEFPHQGWTASFDYAISDTSKISEGDYFTLVMPHVYRIKFDGLATSLTVSLDDGTEAFECYASQQAAYLFKDTILKCDVIGDLSRYSSVSGNLKISILFSNGGSAYQYELENAKAFKANEVRTITFGESLSSDITFSSLGEKNGFYYSGRTTTYNSLESYYLGFTCPNGYVLGATEVIEYDISDENHGIDCSKAQIKMSNKFNDWLFPESYEEIDGDISCSENIVSISVGEMDAGYRIWVNNLQTLASESNTVRNSIFFDYTCTDTIASTSYVTTTHLEPVYVISQGVYTGDINTPSLTSTKITTTSTWSSSWVTTTIEPASSSVAATTLDANVSSQESPLNSPSCSKILSSSSIPSPSSISSSSSAPNTLSSSSTPSSVSYTHLDVYKRQVQ